MKKAEKSKEKKKEKGGETVREERKMIQELLDTHATECLDNEAVRFSLSVTSIFPRFMIGELELGKPCRSRVLQKRSHYTIPG